MMRTMNNLLLETLEKSAHYHSRYSTGQVIATVMGDEDSGTVMYLIDQRETLGTLEIARKVNYSIGTRGATFTFIEYSPSAQKMTMVAEMELIFDETFTDELQDLESLLRVEFAEIEQALPSMF